nr:putative reverse transcriptase domain-containing protein [Tanacetum cinerariifolium]
MSQRRWIKLISDYECDLKYHLGKANVVANALSRKERLKPRRVRAISTTIHSGLKTKILEAQREAAKDLKAPAEWLRGLDTQFEKQGDMAIYFVERIWISSVGAINFRWKWEKITMDLVIKFPKSSSGWDTHLPLVEFSYNNSYHKSIKCAHFEALYVHKCRSPVMWAEVGESQLIRPKLCRQVKKLKRSWIPIVKVRWDYQIGAEFTWERED